MREGGLWLSLLEWDRPIAEFLKTPKQGSSMTFALISYLTLISLEVVCALSSPSGVRILNHQHETKISGVTDAGQFLRTTSLGIRHSFFFWFFSRQGFSV